MTRSREVGLFFNLLEEGGGKRERSEDTDHLVYACSFYDVYYRPAELTVTRDRGGIFHPQDSKRKQAITRVTMFGDFI